MKNYEMTDLGNAKRFSDITNGEYKWIHDWKEWYRWNEATSRWGKDHDFAQSREIDNVLAMIRKELEAQLELADDDKKRKSIIAEYEGWRRKSQSYNSIQSMLKLARTLPGMTIEGTTFDSKGHYLGVKNGVVDLRTGELHQGKKEFLLVKSATVDYEPGGKCPQWEEFVSTIMQGDKKKAKFIQTLMGSALVGARSRKFTFLYGASGANGKSTLIDTVNDIIGDYGVVADPKMMTSDSNRIEYYLAQWTGVRFVLFNESRKDEVSLSEQLVKMTTDSGTISARHPAGRPFNFDPMFTAVFAVNHLPNATMDKALWRRLIIVPFHHQFREDEQVPHWREGVVAEEGTGILNWLVAGAMEYLKNGLKVPSSIGEYTLACKQDMDVISSFMEDCGYYPRAGVKTVPVKEFRDGFDYWCESNGYRRRYSAQSFNRELLDRGFHVVRGTGNKQYILGISNEPIAGVDMDQELADMIGFEVNEESSIRQL